MVRLDGVSFHYGPFLRNRNSVSPLAPHEVLHDLAFEVPYGGFSWLVGESGAGKTSLLRLLSLSTVPSRGRMTVLDVEIGRLSRREMAQQRRNIGVIFQDFRLLTQLSAFDNVALPLRIAGRPEGQIRADVMEMLRWVGLHAKVSKRPSDLSGGEQQRIAIARAVVARPKLLLADEPTGNLDDHQAERLMQLLAELNRLGTTVIVATHNDALVARHPAAEIRLAQGHLVGNSGSTHIPGDMHAPVGAPFHGASQSGASRG